MWTRCSLRDSSSHLNVKLMLQINCSEILTRRTNVRSLHPALGEMRRFWVFALRQTRYATVPKTIKIVVGTQLGESLEQQAWARMQNHLLWMGFQFPCQAGSHSRKNLTKRGWGCWCPQVPVLDRKLLKVLWFCDLPIHIQEWSGFPVLHRTLWATPSGNQLPCVHVDAKVCLVLQQAVMARGVPSVPFRLAQEQKWHGSPFPAPPLWDTRPTASSHSTYFLKKPGTKIILPWHSPCKPPASLILNDCQMPLIISVEGCAWPRHVPEAGPYCLWVDRWILCWPEWKRGREVRYCG